MRQVIGFTLVLAHLLAAQVKSPPAPADYGKWETLVPGGLSPDGKWIAYIINRANGENELRLTNLADRATKVIPFGTAPTFSPDSRWLAATVSLSEAQQDKLRKDKKPVHTKLSLTNLGTGEQTLIDSIQTFAFSPTGTSLAMRRFPPEKTPDPAAPEDDAPTSAPLIVRNLQTARDTALGNAAEYAWQDLPLTGHLLAVSISTDDKTGNGLQLFDAEKSTLRTLDSAPSLYTGLSWRKKSSDLAVLRAKTDEKRDGPSNTALAWTQLTTPTEAAHLYDQPPTTTLRIASSRKPTWSDDGKAVFLGLAPWDEKPPASKKAKDAPETDEPPAVSVWHWRDIDVMPKQAKGAARDRRRNMTAVWQLTGNRLTQLTQDLTSQATPLKNQNFVYTTQWKSYAMDRSIGRPAADLSLLDLTTGTPTKIKDHLLDDEYLHASPAGHYLLYLQNNHYFTVNTTTHATTNITKNIKTSFIDTESDFSVKQLPPFGIAGWTEDDRDVLLYDKYDIWRIAPDGSQATRLTGGATSHIRHRYVRLDPEEEFIDAQKPLYLSLYHPVTKQSGYARLTLTPAPRVETLLFTNKNIDRLTKAKSAGIYSYIVQSFEESPNLIVSGPDLKATTQVTDTNAFQSNYSWSHSELIEYKSPKGQPLQGALYYPAGYQAGKKYPMVVLLYEKLSDRLNHYSPLSERDYYNPSAITSHGYFLLMPDIVFRPREPGLSVVECVTAAIKKATSAGTIDETKIGVIGHSWGGFDSVYLATHTKLFAAAIAGAPITDLISNYGNHHWSNGVAETDHIETGQQRMEVPIYEDLQAYIRNSAVFNVRNMTTPLLIEVGNADGTVFFHQGVELYNIARRAGKEVVLLEYNAEDHSLKKKSDQIDYQRRIFTWFGHFLKGEPAAPWITTGETYLDKQRELKKQASSN